MVSMKVDWKKLQPRAAKMFGGARGQLQAFVDSTILVQIGPYIPYKDGTATKSALLHSKIGSGLLQWKTPYIRYIFFGKSATGKDLVYSTVKHPKAGKEWTERYKADEGKALRAQVQRKAVQLWNNSR